MKNTFFLIVVAVLLLAGCDTGGEKPKNKKREPSAKPAAEASSSVPAKEKTKATDDAPKSPPRLVSRARRSDTEEDLPPLKNRFTPAGEADTPMASTGESGGENTEQTWEKLMESDPGTPFKKREFGAGIMEEQGDTLSQAYRKYPRIHVDDAHAKAHGLSVLRSKRLTLVTDMELTPALRAMPPAVDAAYPQLCEYFGLPEDDHWTLTAFLMKDNIPFINAGYLPRVLPPFKDGFAFNYDCWLFDQPSDYYRQHLLLHEMTHCFMLTTLGNTGPLWMTEGYAEYFGMHDYAARPITLGFMPPNREAVPYCARVRELRDRVAAGRGRTFREVLGMTYRDFPNNEVYIWSWAMMWFLTHHPDTQGALEKIGQTLDTFPGASAQITDALLEALGDKLPAVECHWLMYTASLKYDYALAPMIFDGHAGTPLASGGKTVVTLEADKGWQDTGVEVKVGDVLRIRGAGRYELGNAGDKNSAEKSWPCEPGGVSIRYVMGHPRGMLLAAVCPKNVTPDFMRTRPATSFFAPVAVGLNGTLTAEFSGTLMLRVNDAPMMLEKNSGTLKAEITKK